MLLTNPFDLVDTCVSSVDPHLQHKHACVETHALVAMVWRMRLAPGTTACQRSNHSAREPLLKRTSSAHHNCDNDAVDHRQDSTRPSVHHSDNSGRDTHVVERKSAHGDSSQDNEETEPLLPSVQSHIPSRTSRLVYLDNLRTVRPIVLCSESPDRMKRKS